MTQLHKTSRIVITMVFSVLVIIGVHTVEAWTWAALYLYLGEFDALQNALYFSVVTATTLGYGDITLSPDWQILGTFEAMGGLILFGVSTAFLLELMRYLFREADIRPPPP
jgi:voltage-gated potassium channel Kch